MSDDLSPCCCLLNSGRYEIILDATDLPRAAPYMWHVNPTIRGYKYASRMRARGKRLMLHRYLIDAPRGLVVDHINGNTLDNRRSNLRLCTAAQNVRNQRLSKLSSTGRKGVFIDRSCGAIRAKISFQNRQFNLGTFRSIEEAHAAYCRAAEKLHGEFARFA